MNHKQFPVNLVLAARRLQRLQEVEKECRDLNTGAEVICVSTDATVADEVKNLIETTVTVFGSVDLLYYIVGQAMHVYFENIEEGALDKVGKGIMDVNFKGSVLCTHYALPHLQKSKKGGQIVAISSIAGEISPPFLTFYAAAKHAMHGFFESLRNEEPGITVTIVCPGYVATEIGDKKVVGDGSIKNVDLSADKSKYMTASKACKLIIEGVTAKKKDKIHLTSAGAIGTTIHGLFPGMINSAVRKEMKNITKEKD